MSNNPFDGLEDESPPSPREARRMLLDSAKRGFVPIRNVFIQRDPSETNRASVLAEFVRNRQERALDAFLTLHALQPILADDPLPLGAWANILSTRTPCGVTTASKTFRVLETMGLLVRERRGPVTVLHPLLEDGSKEPWVKAGSRKDGPFFIVPHEFWNDGYIDRLRLPGKAMLLIMLKETQGKPPFAMAVERAQKWYGISERTAERGYRELSDEGLLDIHLQRVASPRLPPGVLRSVYHRALRDPFSTTNRRALQTESSTRTKAARAAASG